MKIIMKIKLKKDTAKKEALDSTDKLIKDGDSIVRFSDYNAILKWQVDVEITIERLFQNSQFIMATLFEKGGFESPTPYLTALSAVKPRDSEGIERKNRDVIYWQIKVLCEIKESLLEKGIIEKRAIEKLDFFPESGHLIYRTEQCEFPRGKKVFALVDFLNSNRNTPWELDEIKKYCNDNIYIKEHQFRAKKDVEDTIRDIRNKFKIKKGELFPIHRTEKGWIWADK